MVDTDKQNVNLYYVVNIFVYVKLSVCCCVLNYVSKWQSDMKKFHTFVP